MANILGIAPAPAAGGALAGIIARPALPVRPTELRSPAQEHALAIAQLNLAQAELDAQRMRSRAMRNA
jgi:hypothetical protein